MKKYEVTVVERHLMNYIVEAQSETEAIEKAMVRYRDGDDGDMLGNEWAAVEHTTASIIEGENETT